MESNKLFGNDLVKPENFDVQQWQDAKSIYASLYNKSVTVDHRFSEIQLALDNANKEIKRLSRERKKWYNTRDN